MEHLVAILIAGVTGVGWGTGKIFARFRTLEERIDRFPIEYVLKQDYIREMEKLNREFDNINDKLDKLIEKVLTK
jgi:hypothetical protein